MVLAMRTEFAVVGLLALAGCGGSAATSGTAGSVPPSSVGAPNAPATDRVLPVLIRDLRARGYRFVTVWTMVDAR
jgi:hypothetical protein